MRYTIVLLALGLSACGVDGEPERPERTQAAPGISISGTAQIGIAGAN